MSNFFRLLQTSEVKKEVWGILKKSPVFSAFSRGHVCVSTLQPNLDLKRISTTFHTSVRSRGACTGTDLQSCCTEEKNCPFLFERLEVCSCNNFFRISVLKEAKVPTWWWLMAPSMLHSHCKARSLKSAEIEVMEARQKSSLSRLSGTKKWSCPHSWMNLSAWSTESSGWRRLGVKSLDGTAITYSIQAPSGPLFMNLMSNSSVIRKWPGSLSAESLRTALRQPWLAVQVGRGRTAS